MLRELEKFTREFDRVFGDEVPLAFGYYEGEKTETFALYTISKDYTVTMDGEYLDAIQISCEIYFKNRTDMDDIITRIEQMDVPLLSVNMDTEFINEVPLFRATLLTGRL